MTIVFNMASQNRLWVVLVQHSTGLLWMLFLCLLSLVALMPPSLKGWVTPLDCFCSLVMCGSHRNTGKQKNERSATIVQTGLKHPAAKASIAGEKKNQTKIHLWTISGYPAPDKPMHWQGCASIQEQVKRQHGSELPFLRTAPVSVIHMDFTGITQVPSNWTAINMLDLGSNFITTPFP